jgi:hypothetical protein
MGKLWKAAGCRQRSRWLLALSIIALTGCQGILLTYKGAVVREGNLIALTDGTQRGGFYQSPDLTIEYQWERSGNELQLSGLAMFTPRIRNGFNLIPYFHLSLFFTDAQGKILEDRRIGTPGSGDPSHPMRLSEKLLLPPETANMAFSYSGQARGSGGAGKEDGGGDMPFWQVPIVR